MYPALLSIFPFTYPVFTSSNLIFSFHKPCFPPSTQYSFYLILFFFPFTPSFFPSQDISLHHPVPHNSIFPLQFSITLLTCSPSSYLSPLHSLYFFPYGFTGSSNTQWLICFLKSIASKCSFVNCLCWSNKSNARFSWYSFRFYSYLSLSPFFLSPSFYLYI